MADNEVVFVLEYAFLFFEKREEDQQLMMMPLTEEREATFNNGEECVQKREIKMITTPRRTETMHQRRVVIQYYGEIFHTEMGGKYLARPSRASEWQWQREVYFSAVAASRGANAA